MSDCEERKVGKEEREGTRQCVTEDLQGTLGDRKKG